MTSTKMPENQKIHPEFVEWMPDRPRKQRVMGWVVSETGCHIWQGKRGPKGYAPQVTWQGRRVYAHRLRYELEIGPIPDGLDLDHYVCDNGPGGCCNPHHCRPATRGENVLRGNSPHARNRRKTHCPKGHPLSGANLDPAVAQRGYRSCKACREKNVRESTKLWKAANREREKEYKRLWHLRRKAKRAVTA